MAERCILCKQTTEMIYYNYYCEDCWRSNSNEYLSEYHRNFNFSNFYRQYPNLSSDTYSIEECIRNAEIRLNRLDIQKEVLEIDRAEGIIIDEEEYSKVIENIRKVKEEIRELQREQQQAQIEVRNR